jgi:AraC family transcriptional regulator
VKQNIETRITIGQLSRQVSMSTYHFARQFKESTGVTPGQFVTRRRVALAKSKLSTEDAIALIAAACGFSNQAHMTRVFKQQTGMTPGQYRKRITRQE